MKKSCLFLVLFSTMLGCAGTQVHQGATPVAPQFDSSTADTLLDIQNTLDGLAAHIVDYPKAIDSINDARAYLTLAKKDYYMWRCLVGASKTLGPSGLECPLVATITVTQQQVTNDINKTQTLITVAKDSVAQNTLVKK